MPKIVGVARLRGVARDYIRAGASGAAGEPWPPLFFRWPLVKMLDTAAAYTAKAASRLGEMSWFRALVRENAPTFCLHAPRPIYIYAKKRDTIAGPRLLP